MHDKTWSPQLVSQWLTLDIVCIPNTPFILHLYPYINIILVLLVSDQTPPVLRRSCYIVPDITLTPPSPAAFRGLWCPIEVEPEHDKEFSNVWAGRLIIPLHWGKIREKHRGQSVKICCCYGNHPTTNTAILYNDRLEAEYHVTKSNLPWSTMMLWIYFIIT